MASPGQKQDLCGHLMAGSTPTLIVQDAEIKAKTMTPMLKMRRLQVL